MFSQSVKNDGLTKVRNPERKQNDTSFRSYGEAPRKRSTQRSRDLTATASEKFKHLAFRASRYIKGNMYQLVEQDRPPRPTRMS